MPDTDIPKHFLLKVLSACWNEHKEVRCWPCYDAYVDSAAYNDRELKSDEHYGIHDRDNCQTCIDDYNSSREDALRTYVTISSPECVRQCGPIVKKDADNPDGGAGWYVEMYYTVGMKCSHCSNDMRLWASGYFISEDGSKVDCWID